MARLVSSASLMRSSSRLRKFSAAWRLRASACAWISAMDSATCWASRSACVRSGEVNMSAQRAFRGSGSARRPLAHGGVFARVWVWQLSWRRWGFGCDWHRGCGRRPRNLCAAVIKPRSRGRVFAGDRHRAGLEVVRLAMLNRRRWWCSGRARGMAGASPTEAWWLVGLPTGHVSGRRRSLHGPVG